MSASRPPIGFAIVGCGRIARRHIELLGHGEVPGARLVALCDTDPARSREAAAKFGVPAHESIAALLEREGAKIDVVSVLTPSGLHAQHAIEVFAHGKHVAVEKPMALRLEDADAMIAAATRAGKHLFVVKQNRFNLPVTKLREALEAGRFGKLVLGTVRVRWCRTQDYYDQDAWRGTWAQDGGVFSNQASHHVDLLQWMLGDVASVYAAATTALADIEAEDTGIVSLRFANGALGAIEATTAARPKDLEGSISILGERGTVEIGGFAVNQMKTWQFSEALPGDAEILGKYRENPPNVYGYGHQRYLEHVVDCLRNDAAPKVDGREGRRSLELITAIYESIASGREVRYPFTPSASKLGRG